MKMYIYMDVYICILCVYIHIYIYVNLVRVKHRPQLGGYNFTGMDMYI
jgi:hypothetical protein